MTCAKGRKGSIGDAVRESVSVCVCLCVWSLRQLVTITAYSMQKERERERGNEGDGCGDVDEKDAQDESCLSTTSCQQPLDTSVVT